MKKAIVIGATSGIGEGLAKLLVNSNYLVGITGRRTELLTALKNQNPNRYISSVFDVTNIETIASQLDNLVEELGGLDLFVICAGTGDLNPTLDFNMELRMVDTNVKAFTYLADWAFHYFEKQKGGHLVGISSIAGLYGGRHAPAYNASKAYQISYLQGLRQKASHLKIPIVVTDIRPGFVATAMAKGEGLIWVASVQKACAQIFSAIQKKRKVAYVTKRWGLAAWFLKVLTF